MTGVRWFGFRGKLFGLVAIGAISSLVLGILRSAAIEEVKIEGTLYKQIERDQELVNELKPARLFVREQYLLAHQIVLEQDPVRLKELIEQFRKSEREYNRVYEEWDRKLTDSSIKDSLHGDCHSLAVDFFDIANREFLPAAELILAEKIGPEKRAAATAVLRGRMKELYDRQAKATEKTADLAKATATKTELQAHDTVSFWWWVMTISNVCILIVVIVGGWWIGRGIVGPTGALVRRMTDMATGAGDLTARVEVTSQDEVGQLAHSINAVIGKIHNLVVQVRESSIQLYASSTEIAATARQQESTMHSLG